MRLKISSVSSSMAARKGNIKYDIRRFSWSWAILIKIRYIITVQQTTKSCQCRLSEAQVTIHIGHQVGSSDPSRRWSNRQNTFGQDGGGATVGSFRFLIRFFVDEFAPAFRDVVCWNFSIDFVRVLFPLDILPFKLDPVVQSPLVPIA